MDEPRKKMRTKYSVKEIGIVSTVVALFGGFLYTGYRIDKKMELRKDVEQILEVDGIKGLSDNELKIFYDETGISPYTHQFDKLSTSNLEKFARNYKQVWVRK